jgi:SAM-dependent methyltransferase
VDGLYVRRRFSRRLVGQGVEIGPGHVPFPVPEGVGVRYVDRWEPSQNSGLFPELGESPGFPRPDVVANLDVDRLGGLADESQDFVIASHVIEHLANPLAMLVDIHRVLRNGGLLVLLVPDRRTTFDRSRPPTPLAHLVDEYERDVREVDDDHIIEYVIATRQHEGESGGPEPSAEDLTGEDIEYHRRRSVHAHVWDVLEFHQLLDFASDELGLHWTVVDSMAPGEAGTHGDEFGWLLARNDQQTPDGVRRAKRSWLRGTVKKRTHRVTIGAREP